MPVRFEHESLQNELSEILMKGFVNLLGSWMLSAGLLLVCGYLWIAFSIGGNLTLPVLVILGLIFLATIAAVVTGAMRRGNMTAVLQCIAIAGVIGLVVYSEMRVSAMREADKPGRIEKNDELMASALSVLPCSNGDTAILKESRHEASNFHSLSIWIVPRDRTQIAGILVSATGKFKPPSDQEVRNYLQQSSAECGNRDYPSLMDLMRRLQAHHETESRKYQSQKEVAQ